MVSTAEVLDCTSHEPLPVLDRSGNTHCYNCIIESMQTQAYNLARRMLDDWSLAEDAVQESFVSGYRAFHQFRGDNLNAWVMRIVANTCRDMLRSRKARPTIPLDPISSDPDDPTAPLRQPTSHPPKSLRKTMQFGRNWPGQSKRTWDSLPEEQRLAVLLVDVRGMYYEEAASAMDCSLGTVKSRLSRGRGQLRDFLRNTGELLPDLCRQEV